MLPSLHEVFLCIRCGYETGTHAAALDFALHTLTLRDLRVVLRTGIGHAGPHRSYAPPQLNYWNPPARYGFAFDRIAYRR